MSVAFLCSRARERFSGRGYHFGDAQSTCDFRLEHANPGYDTYNGNGLAAVHKILLPDRCKAKLYIVRCTWLFIAPPVRGYAVSR
jgi:hypothetical protein